MPLTIGCPNCPTKLKVPDNAGGRRVKCPKCGWVLTVPSGTQPPPPAREAEAAPPPVLPPTPEPPLTPPPVKADDEPPPPVRARRMEDDEDDRLVPPVRAARRREDEEDARSARRRRDDEPTDDTGRLHKGWKTVARGYRMFGLAMLFLLLGVPAFGGTFFAFEGFRVLETSDRWTDLTEKQLAQLAIPFGIGGLFSFLVGLFTLLGYAFLMGMPKPEKGGQGKGLAIAMFFLLFVGLGAISALLLPFFSAGVGTALGKPKLKKVGLGLLVWYLVGLFGVPLLTAGAFFGIGVGLGDGVLASIVSVAVGTVLGVFVFFSVWGTFISMRRGIQASVRERGIVGGEDPRPADEPKRKRRDRADEDDDRPRRRKQEEADRDEPDNDPPPPAKRATRTEDDEDDRPKKRKRDDDEDEGDRPRKRR